MEQVVATTATSIDNMRVIPDRSKSAAEPPPDLPLVQFGLRALFLAVAGISVLVAVLVVVEGYLKLAILLAVLAIAGHVAGAMLGVRLRANSERRRRWRELAGVADPDQSASRVETAKQIETAIAGPLGNQSTRLPWMPLVVTVSAILGGVAGACGLSTSIGDHITLAGLVVGAFSTSALAAWFGFVASGFFGISRHAWRDALAQHGGHRAARDGDG